MSYSIDECRWMKQVREIQSISQQNPLCLFLQPKAIALATTALRYWKGSVGPSHKLHHCIGTSWRKRKVAIEWTAEDISEETLRTLLRADNWQWMVWIGKEAEQQAYNSMQYIQ